ncbi:RNA polymerase sigma factor [Candidatus Dojkabacteria bacterium]|nr:RNA polymerase sigma factor [Candidatus Dojkabacteria bacterium]
MDIYTQAIKGDKEAFETIYVELYDGLWRYVYSRIKNPDFSSDIVSESFIALFENLRNIQNVKAIKSYLYKIAINKMNAFYANNQTVPNLLFDADDILVANDTDIEDADGYFQRMESATSKQKSIKLEAILSKLPARYQEVLRLRFLSNLSIKEVSDVMDISEGNVKVLQNRAIKKAKEIINSNENL